MVFAQNFGDVGGPTKALYCSVNADRVKILFGGGGDTLPLFSGNEFVNLFALTGGGERKT